ncbi:MAG TPA: ferredoxin [Candidatus Angelobacter sp.]|nr:ferredoxin [Candidatus Angelobacter sp.]
MSRHAAVVREARAPVPATGSVALRIDPSVCDGVGICAHLAPDLVTVDSWGYPILRPGALRSASERRQAEAAVAACPRKALRLKG